MFFFIDNKRYINLMLTRKKQIASKRLAQTTSKLKKLRRELHHPPLTPPPAVTDCTFQREGVIWGKIMRPYRSVDLTPARLTGLRLFCFLHRCSHRHDSLLPWWSVTQQSHPDIMKTPLTSIASVYWSHFLYEEICIPFLFFFKIAMKRDKGCVSW